MPLSEYEQRVLEQLEQDLGQDPSLHRAMSRGPRAPGRIIVGVLGVIAGLGIVLVGVTAQVPLVGIAGFVLMAGAALWALLAPRRSSGTATSNAAAPPSPSSPARPSGQSFMERFEDRFNKRREQGDL